MSFIKENEEIIWEILKFIKEIDLEIEWNSEMLAEFNETLDIVKENHDSINMVLDKKTPLVIHPNKLYKDVPLNSLILVILQILFYYKWWYIWKTKRVSKEIEELKSSKLITFEIISKSNNKIEIIDILEWKKYSIIWEIKLNEIPINSVNIGSIGIAFIIQINNEWHILKNVAYPLIVDNESKEQQKTYKMMLQKAFQDVEGLLDIEKTIYEMNNIINDIEASKFDEEAKIEDSNDENLKDILKEQLSQWYYKKALRFLKNNWIDKFMKFITKKWVIYDNIEELAIKYLEKEENQKKDFRYQLLMEFFINDMEKNGIFIYAPNHGYDVDKLFKDWCKKPNKLFWSRSPEEEFKEVIPDLNIWDNIEISVKEVKNEYKEEKIKEFFGPYNKRFTDDEYEEFDKSIKFAEDNKFCEWLESTKKLMKRHWEFYRIVFNYTIFWWNCILSKYYDFLLDEDVQEINKMSLNQIIKDIKFIVEIENKFKYIKELNPDYQQLKKLMKDKEFKKTLQIKEALIKELVKYSLFRSKIDESENKNQNLNRKLIKIFISTFEINSFLKFLEDIGSITEYINTFYKLNYYIENELENLLVIEYYTNIDKDLFIIESIIPTIKTFSRAKKINIKKLDILHKKIIENKEKILNLTSNIIEKKLWKKVKKTKIQKEYKHKIIEIEKILKHCFY